VAILSRFDKIDKDLASRFTWSIAIIVCIVQVLNLGEAFKSSKDHKENCKKLSNPLDLDSLKGVDDSCISVIAASSKISKAD